MSTPKGPEDIGQLAAEVGRRFGLYHEQVDRLQTERTQGERTAPRRPRAPGGGDRARQPKQ